MDNVPGRLSGPGLSSAAVAAQAASSSAGAVSSAVADGIRDSAADAEAAQIRAIALILRDILRAVAAGLIAGAVVGGLGGRVVMRAAALIVPESSHARTENGNLIGDITLDGTLALVTFGGAFAGLLAAAVWTVIAPWVPGRGIRRGALAAVIAVALGGFVLIQSHNTDFLILRSNALVVGLLVGLVAVFGFAFALLEERLDRRLPRPGVDARQYTLTAGALVVFGSILVLPLTLGVYFGATACLCSVAPIPLAVPLIVAGVATAAWWAQRVLGRGSPTAGVRIAGQLGLLAAVLLGGALIATEVAAILD